ncbi:hypothetical protein NPIL_257101 [Nephila pilipes]|uniref:Uncharacterized protein n=1 Tax=Nephila pilipes TaxID=299642 RepID=A0A8X6NGP1_NEPPI|nr:hypothetical protein NPIL_257101 [Nephila pilipes]
MPGHETPNTKCPVLQKNLIIGCSKWGFTSEISIKIAVVMALQMLVTSVPKPKLILRSYVVSNCGLSREAFKRIKQCKEMEMQKACFYRLRLRRDKMHYVNSRPLDPFFWRDRGQLTREERGFIRVMDKGPLNPSVPFCFLFVCPLTSTCSEKC